MKLKVFVLAVLAVVLTSCGGGEKKEESASKAAAASENVELDPMKDKGIGPIKSVTLGEIDENLAATGKDVFKAKCSACHKTTKRFIGPAMAGVTERRTPEWIMNMILNPEEMVQKNPAAKKLLEEYLSPMANQSLTEDEARQILEYFRTLKAE